MATTNSTAGVQGLGVISLLLGVLGLALFWWLPLGIVLSLAGIWLGLVGWLLVDRRFRHPGWLLSGVVVSVAALILDIVTAALGLYTLTFTALR